MRNTLTIAKKELKTFLYSPIAYILTAFFLLISGFFFYNILVWFNEQSMRMMQSSYGQPPQVDINRMLYEPFFNNIAVILMFLLPLLTMRLFADEKRMRTEEMLLTSPIRIGELIAGKFIASLVIYLLILILTATFSLFVFFNGNPALAPILTAYLGLFLLGSVFIAIGMFASSLTENQVIAAMISFSSILLIWVINWVGESAGPSWRGVLTYVSLLSHFQNMVKGVIDTQDIIYFLSMTSLGLYLTYSIFEFRKWR